MKKIVLIHSAIKVGGAEKMIVYLTNLLAEKYSVFLLLLDNGKPAYQINDKVKIFSLCGLFQATQECGSKIEYIRRIHDVISAIKKKAKEINPDMIIVFDDRITWISWLAFASQNFYKVYSQRNDPYDKSKIKNLVFSYIYKHADGVVFQLNEVMDFYHCNGEKYKVIYNPLTISRKKYSYHSAKKILAAGRFQDRKRFDLLIEAFNLLHKEYPDFELYIYGDGEERVHLQGLIEKYELDDYVKMPGMIPNVIENNADALLFVLPSDSEGMPNALIEAMATGIPCVATDCSPGGARMLMNGGENGILVPKNDCVALKNAMKEYIEFPEERARKAENAYKFLERMLSERIDEEWLTYIYYIMKGK